MPESLLLEIGTEELPAGAVAEGLAGLSAGMEAALTAARLAHGAVKVYGTPRRLAVIVEGLADGQEAEEKSVKGPPLAAALAADGTYTKAATGFARAQGVAVEELERREVDGGEYLFAIRRDEGSETMALLPAMLSELVLGLSFSKSMRWGNGRMRFSRPVRWLLARYGGEIVRFGLEGLESGGSSRGHRFLAPAEFEVQSADVYVDELLAANVMVDREERRSRIISELEKAAVAAGGELRDVHGVMDEVVDLVEWPTVIKGVFAEEFLDVPSLILITAMQSHQRYFPIVGSDGALMPAFLTVQNGDPERSGIITAGNERVLSARLSDARFFFNEDSAVGIGKLAEGLENVVFIAGLGTLADKARRLERLAGSLAEALCLPDAKADAVRAAALCKADLVSSAVMEFPSLQGEMGAEYARLAGEPEGVATAINEHYLPRGAADSLPESDAGLILSLADKLDNIVSLISVGLLPSGSEDPYSLRRQALGAVNSLLSRGISADLVALASLAATEAGIDDRADVLDKVSELFRGRVRQQMVSEGFRYDIVEAVLAGGNADFLDARRRAEALADAASSGVLDEAMTVFERCANLSKGAEDDSFDSAKAVEESEKALAAVLAGTELEILRAVDSALYGEALDAFAGMRPAVDRYFDEVLIMVEDEAVRANRLRLLKRIAGLGTAIAALGKIVRD